MRAIVGMAIIFYFTGVPNLNAYVNNLQAGTRTIELELTTLSSTHHVELNPSDAGFQDRYIVQEIIKEMARNRPIDTKGKRGFKGMSHLIFLFTLIFASDISSCWPVTLIQNALSCPCCKGQK